MIVVGHLVGLCLFMIVKVSFGHPQPTPAPNRRIDVSQLHFPRATLASELPNTQTTSKSGLALTVQPIVVHAVYVECLLVSSALSFCDSASPGFNTMDPSKQVSCLCYNSYFWTPAFFGDVASDCDQYFSTQGSSINSQELSLNELCFTVTLATSTSSTNLLNSGTTSLPGSPTTNQGTSAVGSPPGFSSSSPTGSPGSGTSNPIQNLTPAEKGGISVGCGVAALLAGYGIFVGCHRKRKQEDDTIEQVDGSFPSTKEKRSSIKGKSPSVSEIPRGQSVEIHDAHYVLPARVTI